MRQQRTFRLERIVAVPYRLGMDSAALTRLRAEVESRFWGAGARPWRAPRAVGQGPEMEEYSRCLDPHKYVIIQQRATAWTSALVDAGVATGKRLGMGVLPPWGSVETTALSATRPGTEKVFLHLTSEHLVGAVVAYGEPEVVLTAQPVCGCDACDDGSDPLLEAIDDAFESAVMGEVLIEHGKRSARVVTGLGESTSSTVRPEPNWVVGRWQGAAWLG